MPFIGDLPIEYVHEGSLGRYREARREAGVSAGTINKELGFVRRVLILASRKWRYPNGTRYLDEAPLIGQVKGAARKPYPLEWTEQRRLLAELPPHLERVALFDVNTGLRSAEMCGLKWSWEIEVPELDSSVFLLPEEMTKNGEKRIVVLNRIARSVVESQRGKHPEYVFTYKEKPLARINNHAWRKARARGRAERSDTRSASYVWSSPAGFGRELRRPSGSTGPPIREDHNSLQRTGHFATAGCRELDLRAAANDSAQDCSARFRQFRQFAGRQNGSARVRRR
jgi:integrase